MPNPVRVVEVIVPVPSDWLESLKMFRTSICEVSGAWAAMLNSGASFSPGSLTPFFSAAVGTAATPPSTASGPRSFESRCVDAGKTLTFVAAGRQRVERCRPRTRPAARPTSSPS